jgi:hypothetical protein
MGEDGETRAHSIRSCANLSQRYLDPIARLQVEIAELGADLREPNPRFGDGGGAETGENAVVTFVTPSGAWKDFFI